MKHSAVLGTMVFSSAILAGDNSELTTKFENAKDKFNAELDKIEPNTVKKRIADIHSTVDENLRAIKALEKESVGKLERCKDRTGDLMGQDQIMLLHKISIEFARIYRMLASEQVRELDSIFSKIKAEETDSDGTTD